MTGTEGFVLPKTKTLSQLIPVHCNQHISVKWSVIILSHLFLLLNHLFTSDFDNWLVYYLITLYLQDRLVGILTSLREGCLELYSWQEYRIVFSPQWAYLLWDTPCLRNRYQGTLYQGRVSGSVSFDQSSISSSEVKNVCISHAALPCGA
jgi:hypothetical protein